MRKKLLVGLSIVAVIVVGFLIVVAMQPSDYRVSRSVTVAAPAAAVFPQVNEIKKWEPWSPWMKLDPNATSKYEGPAAGVGAAMIWAGNNEVGEGMMTITESKANELVRFHLDFYKPMAGAGDAEFAFRPEGNGTTVTWTMTGKNNFIGKAFCLIMNMDKMIGGNFEKGLADLKAIAEAKP